MNRHQSLLLHSEFQLMSVTSQWVLFWTALAHCYVWNILTSECICYMSIIIFNINPTSKKILNDLSPWKILCTTLVNLCHTQNSRDKQHDDSSVILTGKETQHIHLSSSSIRPSLVYWHYYQCCFCEHIDFLQCQLILFDIGVSVLEVLWYIYIYNI